MTLPEILLASQSPRRAELLRQIGVVFEQQSVDVDETPQLHERPEDYVTRLANDKAKAGWQWQIQQGRSPLLAVLGSDTSVVLGQQILGKPRDQAHAMTMLKALAGKTHQVMTAVSVLQGGCHRSLLSVTDVSFRPLNTAEIEAYCLTGEPEGKAGGYAIQGRGAILIERIEGTYSGVVGLPLMETHQLLTTMDMTP